MSASLVGSEMCIRDSLNNIRLPAGANDAQLKAFYDTWMKAFHAPKETVAPRIAHAALEAQLRKAKGMVGATD
eukprot:232258-Alexandrium_andersonii.AAC.1